MAKSILIEEFHVSVYVPVGLSKSTYASMRRTLNSTRFQSRLRNAVLKVFRRHPPLKATKFTISV